MFKVNQRDRAPLLSQLFAQDSDLALYSCVEVLGAILVWHIEAIQLPDDVTSFERRRRFQVTSLEEAVDIMAAPEWQTLELYVLLPTHLSGMGAPTLARCIEIWECQEPEHEQSCLRLETSAGNFLHSLLGTQIGQETKRRAWFRSVDFEPTEPLRRAN